MLPMVEDERITLIVGRLYDHFASLKRGDRVTHEEVERLAECRRFRERKKYDYYVEKLRKRLLDGPGVVLRSVRGVGYELATPDGQIDTAADRAKRAKRQVVRGIKAIDCLPQEECTDHERRKAAFMKSALRNSGDTLDQEMKTLREAIRATEVLPRRRIDPAAQSA